MIKDYNDFCTELYKAGFSGAIGGMDDGVFKLFGYGWGAESDNAIFWHTGDPETDPWEWRIRVLDERDDIAYSKVFFRKAGYITKEWYPYFLAARRDAKAEHSMMNSRMAQSANIRNGFIRFYGITALCHYISSKVSAASGKRTSPALTAP